MAAGVDFYTQLLMDAAMPVKPLQPVPVLPKKVVIVHWTLMILATPGEGSRAIDAYRHFIPANLLGRTSKSHSISRYWRAVPAIRVESTPMLSECLAAEMSMAIASRQ